LSERGYLSIGEVLSLLRPEFADLTISKIRFLESQGLLNPERTPSGYRKFYEHDIDRLRWILRQQREQYLPLKVIKGRLGSDETEESEEADEAVESVEASAAAGNGRDRPDGRPPGGAPHPSEARPVPQPSALSRVRQTSAAVVPERGPFDTSPTGVSLTLEELAGASELRVDQVQDLDRFGLLSGRSVAGTTYYDDDALIIAKLAGGFLRFGVEARHLRMYKTAAEREAGFFEQLVMPLVKQRNPASRRQAIETLQELGRLGQGLRGAMLRQALRDYTGA
jgi:DNA-binding transcriptional MerR regulator